jgi:hypothetical protein
MNDIRAGGENIVHFLAQLGEVGGQDGGGDAVSHGITPKYFSKPAF